jgi:N-acetylated-alpha-linked acidic dipeptidase
MKFRLVLAITSLSVASLTALVTGSTAFSDQDHIMGFMTGDVATERQLEARFESMLTTENADHWMERLTAQPNHLGSAFNHGNAEYVAALYESWGYQVEIAEYDVLFPTPKIRELELISPTQYTARLMEMPLDSDPSTRQTDAQLPPYVAYGSDGDVTAEIVFVNRGVPADYEELARRGISVEGKIVIAKFGGSWRGIKPKVAAENGAIGTIIYSDPGDDGYGPGAVYPEGPFKNEWGVQRGSILDLPVRPGDPLTPFVGATADAERLPLSEAETLIPIPVLPISYSDALPILRALGGPEVPEDWRGALPITYRMGPGPATVRLHVEYNWDLATAYDVIATLPGAERPDEWVIRGNHRDGWVNGAADPISGHVAMMEEARVLGELYKNGWRPRRTIVYASWDAEEPALLGSTEWVEEHAAELREKAVIYINTDGTGRGFLNASGTPSLESMFEAIAYDIEDPQTGVSVAERRLAANAVNDRPDTGQQFRLPGMGAGSDWGPFYQHLGIPSLSIGYGGENPAGVYHTIYDTYAHYMRFGDPGMVYSRVLANTTGLVTLRMANATVLPFAFSRAYKTYGRYVDELIDLSDKMRGETVRHNSMVASGAFTLAADPTKTYVPPEAYAPVPHLNFAPLQNAIANLTIAADAYHEAIVPFMAGEAEVDDATINEANRVLYRAEQQFTPDHGLIHRPWYRHHIDAPGLYTGYGVKTMPAVREAIEERSWDEADEQIIILAGLMEAFAAEVNRAAGILGE